MFRGDLIHKPAKCLALLVLACGLLWSAGKASADEDFTAGMSLYIQGDYEQAQAHWLKSARASNPRAMFNLGLLHDEGKIANADPQKAERWFDLAGKSGYASADYHFANLLIRRGAPASRIENHLRRAVKNGSFPAREMLKRLTGGDTVVAAENPVSEDAEELAKIDANIGEPEDSSEQQRYLTEDWIASKKSSEWTIQMLAFQDEAKVREFIDIHDLHREAAYFEEQTENGKLFKLVYGSYGTKRQADAARNLLSPDLRQHGPWLRTVKSVQAIIAKQ